MSWEDLMSLLIVIVGAILFLYGANYYNTSVGYAGMILFVGGIVVYAVLKAYESIIKKKK